MPKTLTARGSLGAKMEAADATSALALRLETHSEDISLESYPTQANLDSLIRQITETIEALDWAEVPERLTMLEDGVDGRDLGVIGSSQYAITDAGEIMRRSAGDVGTYGGWRWECSATHARSYPVLYEKVIRAIDGMEAWL